MTARRGLGTLVTAGIAGACLLGAGASFVYGQGLVRASDGEREARDLLIDFSRGMARCGVGKLELPASTLHVPAQLAAVSGKKYQSTREDWLDEAYQCARFSLSEPQILQYTWEKQDEGSGRVLAIGDLDADGKPDKWFEVWISCPTADSCQAPNYVVEVLADGTRVPPSLLRWLGRAEVKLGEPPALEDEPTSRANGGSRAEEPVAAPPPLDGSPATLSAILSAAETQANAALGHPTLLEFEATKLRGSVVDPSKDSLVRVTFGVPDPLGAVAAGGEVLVLTFTTRGLQETHAKASRELHSLPYPGCLPDAALEMLEEVPVSSLVLSWDAVRKRALWSVSATWAKPKLIGADACTLVVR